MKPAARVGDLHICPLVTVLVPHVGGPVLPPGQPQVLIGAMPAARVADMATCVGPPDAVALGAFTTLIGAMPAARMTDLTAHGGMVAIGFPTVLIGDAPASVTVVRRGNVFIIVDRSTHMIYMVGVQEFSGDAATQAFINKVTGDINSTWSGPTTFEGQAFTVDAMISGRPAGPDGANPMANPVIVTPTTQPPSWHRANDPAYVDGNGVTHLYSTVGSDGTLTTPHEFGHTMGLPDEYREGPRNPDGSRTIVHTGPPGGLMGHTEPGSRPTPDNFNSLITGTGLH